MSSYIETWYFHRPDGRVCSATVPHPQNMENFNWDFTLDCGEVESTQQRVTTPTKVTCLRCLASGR